MKTIDQLKQDKEELEGKIRNLISDFLVKNPAVQIGVQVSIKNYEFEDGSIFSRDVEVKATFTI